MRAGARRFTRDDRGVSEVVGYILTFALSAIILLISIQSFSLARENSDAVITGVELKTIATRVSTRVIEAGLVAQEFPNATFSVTIQIPQDLNGHRYYIEADADAIYAVAQDITATAEASTMRLEEVQGMTVDGRVYSSNERVVITYSPDEANKITISG